MDVAVPAIPQKVQVTAVDINGNSSETIESAYFTPEVDSGSTTPATVYSSSDYFSNFVIGYGSWSALNKIAIDGADWYHFKDSRYMKKTFMLGLWKWLKH